MQLLKCLNKTDSSRYLKITLSLFSWFDHRVVVITGLTPCTRMVGGRLRVMASSLET